VSFTRWPTRRARPGCSRGKKGPRASTWPKPAMKSPRPSAVAMLEPIAAMRRAGALGLVHPQPGPENQPAAIQGRAEDAVIRPDGDKLPGSAASTSRRVVRSDTARTPTARSRRRE